jgi:hypothetical protein
MAGAHAEERGDEILIDEAVTVRQVERLGFQGLGVGVHILTGQGPVPLGDSTVEEEAMVNRNYGSKRQPWLAWSPGNERRPTGSRLVADV